MAATARRRDPDDDIAAIAKQISDQAEAIYQNWKSRGLAPADLISCHAAGDTSKLGSMLKPAPTAKPPSIELLAQAPTMDNNRLEKLVKNFVDEDKARIAAAAAARNKPAMPSSIQYALQKFESKGEGGVGYGSGKKTTTLPNRKSYGDATGNGYDATNSVQQTQPIKPLIAQKPQLSPKPRLGETIEMTLPPELTAAGLQTWPLKNRVISTDTVKKSAVEVTSQYSVKPTDQVDNHRPSQYGVKPVDQIDNHRPSQYSIKPVDQIDNHRPSQYSIKPVDQIDNHRPLQYGLKAPDHVNNHQYGSKQSEVVNHVFNGKQPSSVTIDEVALEEKRLINALKNGDIVSEEPTRLVKDDSRDVDLFQYHTPSRQSLTNTKDHNCIEIQSTAHSTPATTTATCSTKWGLRTTTPRRPIVEQQVPHPELTTTQRQHLRQVAQHAANSQTNPVRPFLTRGSVAERVLIFERCPTRSELLSEKRNRIGASSGTDRSSKPQPLPKQPALQHTTLQRHVRAHRNVNIPRFHFPVGKPGPPGHLDIIRTKVAGAFAKFGERASREHFGLLAQACQLPLYWKTPLYLAACADKGSCSMDQFMTFFQNMSSQSHDAAARFVYVLTRGRRSWLAPEDFIPMVQDVVETHPGLTFLKEATEFHSRYVHTVIARIYYCVNRSWSGKITIPELRRSNLLNIIQLLEDEEDINQITQYFSYEHFYVIYCKFWELDRDHDLFIDKQDLTRHNDHGLTVKIKRLDYRVDFSTIYKKKLNIFEIIEALALSSRIIDRIFCGCVTRGNKKQHEEKMSYTDFVWFLLSEEDKLHQTAVEYWFRCMDLDGDGYLSMYELEYFYEEQMHRMEAIGIETLPFQDCLCQMLDMVKPKIHGKISLSDLKKCRMTSIFYDTFFNLEKYLDHEQRDPFASQRDHDIDGQEMSDWDKYAAEEYELLVAEEGGNDQQDSLSFDEGNEEDLLSQHLDGVLDEDPAELSEDSDECSI